MKFSKQEILEIEKIAMNLGSGFGTSTIKSIDVAAPKFAKSIDKIKGVGEKALSPGKIENIVPKNVTNAVTTTKGISKTSNFSGDNMKTNILTNAYNQGAQEALIKIAVGMPPQMPMEQVQQQMQPQQQMPPEQMQPPVAPQMQGVQQDMAAMQPPVNDGQPTGDELQQVQNSGITSGDIASAAKVIQTMAEMKANADMAGMQAQDPEAMGQQAMPAGA